MPLFIKCLLHESHMFCLPLHVLFIGRSLKSRMKDIFCVPDILIKLII